MTRECPVEPRFVVDVNVGALAKWLRALGYDALYDNSADDDELVRIGLRDGRVLLTRDAGILERRAVTTGQLKTVLIEEGNVLEQLGQVADVLDLDSHVRPFSRCIECNETLEPVKKEEVYGVVPYHVYNTQPAFSRCPSCRKAYWKGTHWQQMKEKMELMGRERVGRR